MKTKFSYVRILIVARNLADYARKSRIFLCDAKKSKKMPKSGRELTSKIKWPKPWLENAGSVQNLLSKWMDVIKWRVIAEPQCATCAGNQSKITNIFMAKVIHSAGPEILKAIIFLWNCISGRFLNFFPVQKLIFDQFRNCKKWNLVKKKISWNWFI